MKAITLLFPIILFMASTDTSQEEKIETFKHPNLNFSFKSTGEWKNNPYHKDRMIYEMVNSATGIHVILWYTGGTESSCEKYLVKMADMKGLTFDKPVRQAINDNSAWVLTCKGVQNNIPIVNILAALSYVEEYDEDTPVRSQGKSYNAVHIAQVWCPAASYEENRGQMEDIIRSLTLTP